MQNINLLFEGAVDDVDIIRVPKRIADNIESVTELYFSWMYLNIDKHHYWKLGKTGEKILSYETESFIWWINTHYSQSNEYAQLVLQHTHLVPEYPIAYF